jgi:hypothetical protein
MSLTSSPRYRPKTNFTLVLDMDETLLSSMLIDESESSPLEKIEYIYNDKKLYDIRVRSFRVPFYDPVDKVGTGIKYDCWGVKRPHLDEFLVFAFDFFQKVVLWSAGRKNYVKRLAKEITKDTHPFDLVWTYDDCTEKGMGKPLKKLLESNPDLGDISKVFIVDDKESSVQENESNGVVIPAYDPKITVDSLRKDDRNLLMLKDWFLRPEVKKSKDVRKLKKGNIFA